MLNINAYNKKFITPLIASYNAGHFEAAKYLLSKGAADDYGVQQRIQKIEEKRIADKNTAVDNSLKWKLGIGAVAVGGGIGALAGGGGGGGGSGSSGSGSIPLNPNIDHPASLDPATFVTTESQAQEGVLAMNSNYAYGHGYDGAIYNRNSDGSLVDNVADGHVKVAVVDSGVDLTHADLAANVLSGLSVTCNNTGCVAGGDNIITDTNAAAYGHGTAVAGVIAATKDNVGMHGVAYNANIMSIGFSDVNGNLTNGDIPGIKYAIDNGAQVVNGSYGSSGTVKSYSAAAISADINTTVGGTTLLTDYQSGVSNHVIFVYSTGNSSFIDPAIPAALPYYFQGSNPFTSGTTEYTNYNTLNPTAIDLSKNWIAVASVDNSNVISSFSNQCGVAKNWCLVAPGEISKSTKITGGYTTAIAGTSFSAPNVSGAVAIMLGAFPHLTPERVVRILFNTATDLGAAGIDDVYGNGLINLQKATNPTDTGWTLASFNASAPFSFYSSGFGLSAPFGNVLAKSNAKLIFVDAYGKDYTIPITAVAVRLQPRETAFDKFNKFSANDFNNSVQLSENTKMAFSSEVNDNDKTRIENSTRFTFQSSVPVGSNNLELGFNYRNNLSNILSKSDKEDKIPENLMASDAYKNPYLSLAGDNVTSSVVGYQTENSSVKIASYIGNMKDDYSYRFDTKKTVSGVYDEYSYFSDDKQSEISVNAGVMVEKNAMLGAETSGAFAIDSSSTYHAGLSGKYEIADGISLIGNYNLGVTRVSASTDSIFNDFGNITTSSMAAGVEFSDIANQDSVLGFSASQPLRVNSGQASLTLPVDIARDGNVLYDRRNLSLDPSGHEFDFESYYHVKLTAGSTLSLNGILRVSPNNDSNANNDATILGKYNLEF